MYSYIKQMYVNTYKYIFYNNSKISVALSLRKPKSQRSWLTFQTSHLEISGHRIQTEVSDLTFYTLAGIIKMCMILRKV